jgi:ribonuclease Z
MNQRPMHLLKMKRPTKAMTFSLTVLGSNSAIPTLQRNPSAHLLNVNERLFLIDCAEGTQLQLRKYRIHFQRIKHIFISHLHGDHYFGLLGLLTSFHLLGRKDEVHLYSNPVLEQILMMQLDASQTRLIYPLHFHYLKGTTLDMIYEEHRLSVYAFPLKHSIPTWGFLFRERNPPRKIPAARSYAYCSDTAYDETIIPYIFGVDLLYHETTFMQHMKRAATEKLHSTTLDAAAIAEKAHVQRLLIGHFSARYEELEPLLAETRSRFPETILAEDGLILNI